MEKPTKISIFSATCGMYGRCWAAQNPYWDGHYATREEALEAARKTKEERDAKWLAAQQSK